ncbi:glutathione S-transferase family protein [Ochrobactrum sp. CM-21-5]|nr:glutathione S-transferase family protein [Ochrobactrum sp. CM-21-5]
MILIGQYDSPFVRRVAIALRLYGLTFEHHPWSSFGDQEKIAAYNPLSRVPTLVLDDGDVLIESAAILDYLDEIASAQKPLMARNGLERRQAMKTCALATGLADKAVSLLYEGLLRSEKSDVWVTRCELQIGRVLGVLESDLSERGTSYWFGNEIGHADIAVACAIRFLREAHPHLFAGGGYPALTALAARCEALSPFQEIMQPLVPPTP